jgi:DDE superfamily endonuclease
MSERRIQKRKSELESPRRGRSTTSNRNRSQSSVPSGFESRSPSKSAVPLTVVTRRCTPVIFIDQKSEFETRMEEREAETFASFAVQPFTVEGLLDKEVLMEMVKDLLKVEEAAVIPTRVRKVRRAKLSWEDKINSQRETVRTEVAGGRIMDLNLLARKAGCCVQTARRNLSRQLTVGILPVFQCNRQRSADDPQKVLDLVTSGQGKYFSISSVKQRLPYMSRKYIARSLKQGGLRYRKLRHTRIPRTFNGTEVCRVLSRALPAFDREDETLLFLDEVIFPLNYTPTHCWRPKDDPMTGYKERTPCRTQLTCIALCSKTRIIAIQVHVQEMQAQAIVHFLTAVLSEHRTGEKTVVLLDNAKYHGANLVRESSLGPYLLLSVARCWELNMIEVLFSKAKELWRRRPVVEGIEEETAQVIRVFRECQVAADFGGYRRQYLRDVINVLTQTN